MAPNDARNDDGDTDRGNADRGDTTSHPDDEVAARRRRRERAAAGLAEEIAEENPDPITRREAIEQGLEEDGLSDEGGTLGQHNE